MRGATSEIPTKAPNLIALFRSSSVAFSSRARSLASPAPDAVAMLVANGIPIPGINLVANNGAKDPRASPNLPPTVSSIPMSACGFRS